MAYQITGLCLPLCARSHQPRGERFLKNGIQSLWISFSTRQLNVLSDAARQATTHIKTAKTTLAKDMFRFSWEGFLRNERFNWSFVLFSALDSDALYRRLMSRWIDSRSFLSKHLFRLLELLENLLCNQCVYRKTLRCYCLLYTKLVSWFCVCKRRNLVCWVMCVYWKILLEFTQELILIFIVKCISLKKWWATKKVELKSSI